MWPFKKRLLKDAAYYDGRMRHLWRTLVPPMDQADTVQGELVRCIGNLEDEGSRNGFANWDEGDEECITYLKVRLPSSTVFDAPTCRAIDAAINVVEKAGRDNEGGIPLVEFEFLIHRVVDWCDAHPEPILLKDEGEYHGHD